ncbi:MAG: hypothetical protein COA78_14920 [Blastopirellula sp.]|nr:MAG: hypothetical protein COA78_14920 [Blastopirellula sp.]
MDKYAQAENKVRAKFRVTDVHNQYLGMHYDGVCVNVKMSPVFDDGTEENKSFSDATPQGSIELTITNPDAVAKFELGKPYYVDFTSAD